MNVNSKIPGRLLVFLQAICVGTLLSRLHLPIPFLMGGMLSSIFFKTFLRHRINAEWPQTWRGYGLMIGGYVLGTHFDSATWSNFLNEMTGVAEATSIAITISIIMAFLISRITKSDLKSCIMGMMPGGLTLMMLMAEEDKNTNPNVVMVMQVLRIFFVLISVPFLAVYLLNAKVGGGPLSMPTHGGIHWLVFIPLAPLGAFIARRLHTPTPQFLGPILVTAIFSVIAGDLQPVPGMLLAAAQASIGLYMGRLLDIEKIFETKKLIPLTVISTLIMVAISICVAYSLSARYGFSLVTAFLAMAPGGVVEMPLAGLTMGEDISIILTYQLVRVFAINLLVGPLLAWYFKEH